MTPETGSRGSAIVAWVCVLSLIALLYYTYFARV
jgi:hypothetical protein